MASSSSERPSLAEIKALIGRGPRREPANYDKLEGKTLELKAGSLSKAASLFFNLDSKCVFRVGADSDKIFVNGCIDCTFEFSGRVRTNVVELTNCTGCKFVFHTGVGTLQVDLCNGVGIEFAEAANLGNVLWAGCEGLTVKAIDTEQEVATGLSSTDTSKATVPINEVQHKISIVDKELVNEAIIRLPNGFPTTQREKDAFDAMHERNMKLVEEHMDKMIRIETAAKKAEGEAAAAEEQGAADTATAEAPADPSPAPES